MPELPEVEIVKRVLEPQIRGQIITEITINNPQAVARPGAETFCGIIKGQKIAGMERRGKFLSLCLQSGDRILLHLRMTGCLLAAPATWPMEKHTHVVFQLQKEKGCQEMPARSKHRRGDRQHLC